VSSARSREIEGSGLGLSRAREIARAHGGELALQRSEELETAFALTLPLAHPGRGPHAAADGDADAQTRTAG